LYKAKTKYFIISASAFLIVLLSGKDIRCQSWGNSFGINAGISSFESRSTSVSGIQLSAFYEFPAWFTDTFNFQASIFYLKKTEYFLPDDSDGRYYPYFYGATFSGIMRQKIKEHFFIEEQAGVLLMKDRFFSGNNGTNYGICFGGAAGIDFRSSAGTGVLLSTGYKGGITFNGDNPGFNSFFIQLQIFL